MSSTVHDHRGPWRFDDLAQLPDDGRRYEVVDGSLVVSPPPSQAHQLLGAGLLRQLTRQCPDDWVVAYEFPLPMGTDGRVPDLAVVRADAPFGPSRSPYPVGPAHVGLLVEIVSPSSRKTDRFAKPGEYAEAGIPLFWRVESEPDLLLVAHRLADGRYEEVAAVAVAGLVPVPWGTARIDLASLAR
jgi:Uma2 family endonuclease